LPDIRATDAAFPEIDCALIHLKECLALMVAWAEVSGKKSGNG
jgi:hypothetical protein